MIRALTKKDLPACAELLCAVYNNELWQCRWDQTTAEAYLLDFLEAKKFVGFALLEEETLVGAILCHEKIWWNNSELFVDEMFVKPALQRRGNGGALLEAAESYVADHRLAGLTLTTNRYAPAPQFYRKHGFADCEHVLYMGKEIG